MFYKSCYCSPGQDHMQRLWCGLHSQRRTRCWENYLWWWNFEWIQGNQSIWIVPMFLGVFSTLNCNIYHVRRCFAYWLSTFLQLTKFWKSSEKVKNGPNFLNVFRIWILCLKRSFTPVAFIDSIVLIYGCFTILCLLVYPKRYNSNIEFFRITLKLWMSLYQTKSAQQE